MKTDDLKNAPKLFAESIMIGYTPEHFVIGISSGSQAQIYALSPAHAKRLNQYLTHELQSYEKKYSEITAEWNPNVISPIQKTNPPSTES